MDRYYYIFNIALEAVIVNRVRSILTALGIIFGVAAVISMMAIGTGARQEILDQMKLVGVNNIIITPIEKNLKEGKDTKAGEQQQNKFSPGLNNRDVLSIQKFIPSVDKVSAEVIFETDIVSNDVRKPGKLIGVSESFFDVFNLKVAKGTKFSRLQIEKGAPVCVIGPELRASYFKGKNPIGGYIKCGKQWFKVIGVLEGKGISKENSKEFKITNTDKNVYAPLQTVLLRYRDRSVINQYSVNRGRRGGGVNNNFTTINQLDKIVVQVDDSENLTATEDVIRRMLLRRHNGIVDFKITVPELLLKQEQKTKDIFQIVLVAIAGISLIVGGIGIMNIMLASVMERIREIGTRRATGATKRDIILQFLTEAILISVTGGVLGIVLGIFFAEMITQFTDINTIISPISILISFGVSASIGILFGYMPAKRAAKMDPVESLRYQ